MPHSIICTPPTENGDLSLAGTQISESEDSPDEPCCLSNDDTFFFVDDDDPDDDLRPDRKTGAGLRWSEARPVEFWTYFDRFVRYWPKKSFHVKYAYPTGFVEKKRKGTDQSLPLFEELAVEMTERHLDADGWAEWKRSNRSSPIWLALHIPKYTTVDAIDIDAKKYLLGYYRQGSSKDAPLMPVIHLPLEHFKALKRVYDAFPGRIWCISSETLGVHVWKKHPSPRPAFYCHQKNKQILANIGLGGIESHPMPGRCFRRPFGADYRTITPDGVLTHWIEQLNYFEDDGRTPDFPTICRELVKAMKDQWESWRSYRPHVKGVDAERELEKYQHELKEVEDWLAAGCPLNSCGALVPVGIVDPIQNLCRDVLADTLADRPQIEVTPLLNVCRGILAATLGEQSEESVDPLLKSFTECTSASGDVSAPRSKTGNKREDLASLRGGNWAKELLRLARVGLEQEDSVATVVHEMAKWLWWVELHSLPEASRLAEITRLLTAFVLKKHNGCVSRLSSGNNQDVINQIVRCVELAGDVAETKGFEETRNKWLNGGYKYPIRIVPALRESVLTDLSSLRSDKIDAPCGVATQVTFPLRDSNPHFVVEEDVSLPSSCLFTFMCTSLDVPLPNQIQERIASQAGRNKILPFATGLLNRLYNHKGREHLGRPTLFELLKSKSPRQLVQYLGILEKVGVINRGSSYSSGRNGKLITLDPTVMLEIAATRQTIPEGEKSLDWQPHRAVDPVRTQ